MTPYREKQINGNIISEYWWAGDFCVYVNHKLTEGTFEEICEKYRNEESEQC